MHSVTGSAHATRKTVFAYTTHAWTADMTPARTWAEFKQTKTRNRQVVLPLGEQ